MKPYRDLSMHEKWRKRPDLMKVIGALVTECSNPARLLEVYYWSHEPDLSAVMRQIASMTPPARAALCRFMELAAVAGAERIAAAGDAEGRLLLTCPEIPDHFGELAPLVVGKNGKHGRKSGAPSPSRRMRHSGNIIRLGRIVRQPPETGESHGPQKAGPG